MSEIQATDNSNEWIEEAISKKNITYYGYKNFSNIQEIGSGGFGKVYRAKWKNSHGHLALKSLSNLNDVTTVKEIAHEVIIIENTFYLYFCHNIIYYVHFV